MSTQATTRTTAKPNPNRVQDITSLLEDLLTIIGPGELFDRVSDAAIERVLKRVEGRIRKRVGRMRSIAKSHHSPDYGSRAWLLD